jgi:hypothetical protein
MVCLLQGQKYYAEVGSAGVCGWNVFIGSNFRGAAMNNDELAGEIIRLIGELYARLKVAEDEAFQAGSVNDSWAVEVDRLNRKLREIEAGVDETNATKTIERTEPMKMHKNVIINLLLHKPEEFALIFPDADCTREEMIAELEASEHQWFVRGLLCE